MFYDIYTSLCEKRKIAPARVAIECGFSKASVTKWKKTGSTPKQEILIKIADYFGVSVDYLLGNEKTSTDNGEGNISEYKVFAMGGTPGVHTVEVDNNQVVKLTELLAVARELPPEKLDKLIKMAEII